MVRTLFRKYDGQPHRLVEAVRLGEDEHGLWVGSVPGTRGQRADGSWTTIDHHRVRREVASWLHQLTSHRHPTENGKANLNSLLPAMTRLTNP